MSVLDVIGIACVLGAGALITWFGLRQQRRASGPLREQNLAVVAALFGPRWARGQPEPAGRWHRVLRESHSAAALYRSRGVQLFSELVIADQAGRCWHCKLRCDDTGGADEPMLRQLPSATVSWTA
jgi:hypothetical protein